MSGPPRQFIRSSRTPTFESTYGTERLVDVAVVGLREHGQRWLDDRSTELRQTDDDPIVEDGHPVGADERAKHRLDGLVSPDVSEQFDRMDRRPARSRAVLHGGVIVIEDGDEVGDGTRAESKHVVAEGSAKVLVVTRRRAIGSESTDRSVATPRRDGKRPLFGMALEAARVWLKVLRMLRRPSCQARSPSA
jgi:hypothetical protein